jgi:hypothetical protein
VCRSCHVSGGPDRMLDEPHTPLATVEAAALSIANYRRCWLPSRVRSLDKRAGCTTSMVLDVEAAASDRTRASGGVSRDRCAGDHAHPMRLAPA